MNTYKVNTNYDMVVDCPLRNDGAAYFFCTNVCSFRVNGVIGVSIPVGHVLCSYKEEIFNPEGE